jgi:hypothetical protein
MTTNTLRKPNQKDDDFTAEKVLSDPEEYNRFMTAYMEAFVGYTLKFDKNGIAIKPDDMPEGEWEAFCYA